MDTERQYDTYSVIVCSAYPTHSVTESGGRSAGDGTQ